MYEAYWKLSSKPFGCGADTRMYYPAETHQAALLKLRYVIEHQRGAALLAGASGSGKTLLVRILAEQLAEICGPFAHLVFPQLPQVELLAWLAAELDEGATTGAVPAMADSLARIERLLSENAAKGRRVVVAIDDAHLLDGHRAWETLLLLLNFEVAGAPALTLLLVGQAGLLPMLERMPQLEERLGARSLLAPLSLEETMSYVQHRLQAAGASQPIFEQPALETLHELTQGLPRRINRLADLALLVGFAEERGSITAGQVEAVANDLLACA